MCMSPDEMTSAQLEDLRAHYREIGFDYYADPIDKLLRERAENGTYDVVPTVTPRHRR